MLWLFRFQSKGGGETDAHVWSWWYNNSEMRIWSGGRAVVFKESEGKDCDFRLWKFCFSFWDLEIMSKNFLLIGRNIFNIYKIWEGKNNCIVLPTDIFQKVRHRHILCVGIGHFSASTKRFSHFLFDNLSLRNHKVKYISA